MLCSFKQCHHQYIIFRYVLQMISKLMFKWTRCHFSKISLRCKLCGVDQEKLRLESRCNSVSEKLANLNAEQASFTVSNTLSRRYIIVVESLANDMIPPKLFLKILWKSKHFQHRYKRKCEWVFFLNILRMTQVLGCCWQKWWWYLVCCMYSDRMPMFLIVKSNVITFTSMEAKYHQLK